MNVQTDTTSSQMGEIADIKGLHEVGWSRQDIILLTIAASAVLLVAAAIIWSVRRFRRGRIVTAAVEPAPPQEHWAVLVARRLDGLPQQPAHFEDVRKFTFELGALLREVIGQMTQQHALELTSNEIRERILPLMDSSSAKGVDDFLARAELVLFAKIDLGSDVYESGRSLVRTLLQSAIERGRRLELEVKNAPGVTTGEVPL